MSNDKKNRNELYEYVKRIVPSGATINFVFYEDFNGDEEKEALVGFTQFVPFPPESSVIYVQNIDNEIKHIELLSYITKLDGSIGIFDNAVIGDFDNDTLPEIVLSLAIGNGHYSKLFVFDFNKNLPVLLWCSSELFLNGSLEAVEDEKGMCHFIADSGTYEGNELIGQEEASYHFRKSYCYKWDGTTFKSYANEVRNPYRSYNVSISFLMHILKHEYKKAYDMVIMPGFMGLKGLESCNLESFRKYVGKHILPVIHRNLARKKLIPSEPYDDYCLFSGVYEDIALELIKKGKKLFVQSVRIYKKS